MDTHYYILSGLGADERVFANVELPPNHTHLHWIENTPNETLQDYAGRMAAEIKHENPVLIGLSFGGIVAQEIAAIRKAERLILISTVKSRNELPWYFRLIDQFKFLKLIPNVLFTKPNALVAFAFSLTRKEDKTLLKSCFEIMSQHHLKWAITKILSWQGVKYDSPVFSITCSKELIFTSNRKSGLAVVDGGHFAVYTNANAMQHALNKAFD